MKRYFRFEFPSTKEKYVQVEEKFLTAIEKIRGSVFDNIDKSGVVFSQG